MAKPSFISSSNNWPTAFILTFVFIILFESVNLFLDERTYVYPYDGLRMKLKNEYVQTKGHDFDVIIVGDCFNLEGIDPNIIEENTRLKSFNLATHSYQTVWASHILLENYLKNSSKKPKYILIGYLPEVFVFSKKSAIKHSLPLLYDFRQGNLLEFIKEFGWAQAIKFSIPSLKHQDFFKERAWPPQLIAEKDIRAFKEEFLKNKGMNKFYENGFYRGEWGKSFNRYQISPSEFFDENLRTMLDMAKKNDIRVIYTIFAAPPDLFQNLYRANNMMEVYSAYLYELKKTYPDLKILPLQTVANNKEYFRDSVHLNKFGAQIASQYISNVLVSLEKNIALPSKILY